MWLITKKKMLLSVSSTLDWQTNLLSHIITMYKEVIKHNYWLSVLVVSMFHRSQRQKKQRKDISRVFFFFFRTASLTAWRHINIIIIIMGPFRLICQLDKMQQPQKAEWKTATATRPRKWRKHLLCGPVDKQNRESPRLLPLPRSQPASSPAAWPPPWLCAGPSACRTQPTRTAGSPRRRRPATSGQKITKHCRRFRQVWSVRVARAAEPVWYHPLALKWSSICWAAGISSGAVSLFSRVSPPHFLTLSLSWAYGGDCPEKNIYTKWQKVKRKKNIIK